MDFVISRPDLEAATKIRDDFVRFESSIFANFTSVEVDPDNIRKSSRLRRLLDVREILGLIQMDYTLICHQRKDAAIF